MTSQNSLKARSQQHPRDLFLTASYSLSLFPPVDHPYQKLTGNKISFVVSKMKPLSLNETHQNLFSYFSSASSDDFGVTLVVKTAQVNRDAVVWDNDSDPIDQPPTQNQMPTALPRYTPVLAQSQSQVMPQISSQSEPTQDLSAQEPTLKITAPYKRKSITVEAFGLRYCRRN